MVSLRVKSEVVEISYCVYLVGSARITRFSRITTANTTTASTLAYTPLCRVRLLPPCGSFTFNFFILCAPPQFQRRRSSACPVIKRNSPMTER